MEVDWDVDDAIEKDRLDELLAEAPFLGFRDTVAQHFDERIDEELMGTLPSPSVTADTYWNRLKQYEEADWRFPVADTEIRRTGPYVRVGSTEGGRYEFVVESDFYLDHHFSGQTFDHTCLGTVGLKGYFHSDALYDDIAAAQDEE